MRYALAVWLVCLCGAARAQVTLTAPESADVGHAVAVVVEGLPAVELDQPLGPQLAWADRCDLWLRSPDGQSERLDWQMALYRAAPKAARFTGGDAWLWRIRAEFTPLSAGPHWVECDWNNEPAELPARAVFVGEAPTPPPPPPPPPPSDLAARVRGWVGLVKGDTVRAEAQRLAADCRAIAEEARAAADPLSTSELLTADRVVAAVAAKWTATLGRRALAWQPFRAALQAHLADLDQAGEIRRSHLGLADVLDEISAGLGGSAEGARPERRPGESAEAGSKKPPGARCQGGTCSRSPGLFKRVFGR